MFKIPSKISVLGMEILVCLKSPVLDDSGKSVCGLFDHKGKIIQIDSEMDKDDMVQTFLHEVGHAILYRTSVSPLVINHKVEEIVVDSFATVFLEMFKMEPK